MNSSQYKAIKQNPWPIGQGFCKLRLDSALTNWTLDKYIAHRFSAAQAQDTATLNLHIV